MLFKWLLGNSQTPKLTATDELQRLIAQSLPGADRRRAGVIAATAGLLATVAHCNRVYNEAERGVVSDALNAVDGLDFGSMRAIEELLEEHIEELSSESLETYTRVLNDSLDRASRLKIFEMLMEMAAADEVLDVHETNVLRDIAQALGLSDDEFAASHERQLRRLSVLRA